VAVTEKVYFVPIVRPVTVQLSGSGKGAFNVQVFPPGLEVTVYFVMSDPLLVGAVHVTTADVDPTVAVGALTVDGAVAGATDDAALPGSESPL
jgi:hypothetical protein